MSLASVLMFTLAMLGATFFSTSAVQAIPYTSSPAPFITNSYYVDINFYRNTNPNSYASVLGQSDALAENNALVSKGLHCTKGEYMAYTIIDFGSPKNGYVYNWAGNNINYGDGWGQVSSIAQSYANSWYIYSYNCFVLDIQIGVNNSFICGSLYVAQPCDGEAGSDLAADVTLLNNDLASINESWQVLGKGAIDAEGFYDPSHGDYFGSYTASLDLAQGYNTYVMNNYVGWNLYDFGAAGSNCNGPTADWCTNLAGNVYTLAWGLGYDEPFPQAYNSSLNAQWQVVNSYSNSGNQGRIQYNTALLDGTQSAPTQNANWQDFITKNASYIPDNPFYGSAQQPVHY